MLTDPYLNTTSHAYKEFVDMCNRSTEFLFDDLFAQLEIAKQEWNKLPIVEDPVDGPSEAPTKTSNGTPVLSGRGSISGIPRSGELEGHTGTKLKNPMKTGDFVITTHSNVPGINVVFHLAVEKKNNANTSNRLLTGLRNILTVASQYDITTLTLPALFIEPEFKHLFSDQQCIKRAEAVIREVRGFLVESSATYSSLRTIRLVVPPPSVTSGSTVDYFAETTRIVNETFNKSV
mgnify:CR=1 FL=1